MLRLGSEKKPSSECQFYKNDFPVNSFFFLLIHKNKIKPCEFGPVFNKNSLYCYTRLQNILVNAFSHFRDYTRS